MIALHYTAISSIATVILLINLHQLHLQIIQVHETQLVRHGMMVVGESGSGKSTNIKVKILAPSITYTCALTEIY